MHITYFMLFLSAVYSLGFWKEIKFRVHLPVVVLLCCLPCRLCPGQQSCRPDRDRWHTQCWTCQFRWRQQSCSDQAQGSPQSSHRSCRSTQKIFMVFLQCFTVFYAIKAISTNIIKNNILLGIKTINLQIEWGAISYRCGCCLGCHLPTPRSQCVLSLLNNLIGEMLQLSYFHKLIKYLVIQVDHAADKGLSGSCLGPNQKAGRLST